MKHAYLIIAHANPFVLERLIQLLDDNRNDIYIHVDKKSNDFDFDFFRLLPKKSTVIFTERIDVRWGHISQIETELTLFEAASQNGKYAYYHLISGADLPIKSQDYIHDFFANRAGYEFIGFSNTALNIDRVTKIHLFPRYMRVNKDQLLQRLGRKIRLQFLKLQDMVGYNYRNSEKIKFVFGANWVSVTHDFVSDLLKRKAFFIDFYKYSNCADEIYKQTFAFNSEYRDKIYNLGDELEGCMRFIDWQRGKPYIFSIEDYDEIMSSNKLFARKFEDNVDKEIVQKIYDHIIIEQKNGKQ